MVLITVDTLRADHLGCYGYERAQTPNLDRLADESVVFDLASTTSNNTLPAHCSILTGRYPHHLGVPRNSFPLPGRERTLAQVLGARGYRTAAFVGASVLDSSTGIERGFDVFDESFPIREVDHNQRRADTTTDLALEWLGQREGEQRPFLLWVHYFDPHYPYTPPEPFDSLYGDDYRGPADGSMEYLLGLWGRGRPKTQASPADLQRLIDLYDGEIAFLDRELGRLFDGLEPLRERCVVALTSDHGESLTEHGYLFDHGEKVYQPSLHVPLILRGPARLGLSPKRVDAQVLAFDLFPTMLSLAGVPVSQSVDAVDLLPLLRGEVQAAHEVVFSEACRPWDAESPGLYRNLGKAQLAMRYPWKLVMTPYQFKIELYHLGRDPLELDNLAQAEPQVVAGLTAALFAWRPKNWPDNSETPDEANLERLRALGYTR